MVLNKKNSAIVLLALLVASSGQSGERGLTDTEIVTGQHTVESGPFAAYAPMGRAFSAYVDMINEKGGIHGRKIKHIREDVQANSQKAVEATRKLVERDGIFAMVAAQGVAHLAVYKYLNEQGVPDLWIVDGASAYTKPLNKWVFPGFYSNESDGYTSARHAISENKGKKACFLQADTVLGEEYTRGAMLALNEANAKLKDSEKIQIGLVEKADRQAPQADTQVLKFKKEKCDIIFNSTWGSLAPAAMNYGLSQGFKPRWYVHWWNTTPNFISLLKEGVRDTVISTGAIALDESFGTKGWSEYSKFVEKKGIPSGLAAAAGYYLGEMFVETLNRAGRDLTREKLVKAAETFENWYCSICIAPVSTSATNHWALTNPALLTVKNNKWVKVASDLK